MAVFLDFLSCAEHQSYCGKHNLVFTLSCMPLQPNNRRTKWPRNSHYTPNIQNVSVGAATNIVQPRTFSVAMALVEHSILLKCWAKIGISGAIGVSRMPLTQRQRVNIQRNLTVAGLPYWRLSMAALLRIADRVGLRAKRPQLADIRRSARWSKYRYSTLPIAAPKGVFQRMRCRSHALAWSTAMDRASMAMMTVDAWA